MICNDEYNNACICLGLENVDFYSLTFDQLKRQYRMMALKYHPDKNKDENALMKFQEVQNAYEYLKKYVNMNDDAQYDEDIPENMQDGHEVSSGYYGNMLHSFMKNVLKGINVGVGDYTNTLICSIVSKIMNSGESHSLDYLKKVDKHILLKIYDILCKYRDVLHVDDSFLEQVKEIVVFKFENDECIVLNPFIDDLLNDQLYKLKENGNTYIVPLWHHELVYDNSGSDLYVKCNPLLPENMQIDENNNIHIDVFWDIASLWDKKEMDVSVGQKIVWIQVRDLRLQKVQKITFREMGISRVNPKNMYDVNRKGDIVVHVHLLLS